MQPLPENLLPFLDEIGISWRFATITEPSFLPGLKIENGALLIDREKLLYPGDILHEAGHLAMVPENERGKLNGNVGSTDGFTDGEEIGAMLWSYAALTHLKLAPEIVFHPAGYRGQSDWFIETFTGGHYVGLPLLEWMGLTASPKKAKELGIEPFPHMLRWLRA